MDDTKKMLQAIIHGQNSLQQSLEKKIDQVHVEVKELRGQLHTVDNNLTKRIDVIGKAVAYLEDDAPTREEFDGLEKRVEKIEEHTSVNP